MSEKGTFELPHLLAVLHAQPGGAHLFLLINSIRKLNSSAFNISPEKIINNNKKHTELSNVYTK